jgi:hypothetical protein
MQGRVSATDGVTKALLRVWPDRAAMLWKIRPDKPRNTRGQMHL